MSEWLDERVEGDVFEVFASIDETEGWLLRNERGLRVVAVERIRLILCNVVVGFTEMAQDVADEVFAELRYRRLVHVQDELIEE